MHTTEYKIIKSSWGIWIRLTGQILASSPDQIKATKSISFILSPDCINLSEKEIDYIKRGIRWIEGPLKSIVDDPFTIEISNIDLIHADYQPEGLYYAIALWLAEYYGFDLPLYEYSYNPKQNRYEFYNMVE